MDFTKRETNLLRTWKKEKLFTAALRRNRGKKHFVFFEGPPTANGRPGIHHVLVRAMKDAFLRYKTMRGYDVPRRAGWDTHGLPVELQVERALGFRSKQEIERYGIARFNAKAKRSVWRYKDEWERLDDRIGFWIDQDHPYITYENRYIESVWGVLKRVFDQGLLEEDFKVVPWCPRCGTALSSHEVAQGYRRVTENSVFVKFRVKAETDEWKNTSILAWTTTPWTLPGNVALAVHPKERYVCVPDPIEEDQWIVLGETPFRRLVAEGIFPEEYAHLPASKIDIFNGAEMLGIEYEPLFDIPEIRNAKSHRVYAADFVTTEEGTGVVHTAVMYGEDDYVLGNAVGLAKVHTVSEEGRFLAFVPDGLAGRAVKEEETEETILDILRSRVSLFQEPKPYAHDYPFCWRCETPLLYYATRSWFIRMSKLRRKLVSENEKIQWVPKHLKRGRFGEWLREVKDWAISRERYWGTPLPAWRCDKEPAHVEIIGSVAELVLRAKLKNRYLTLRHGHATNNDQGFISSYPEARAVTLTARGRREVVRAASVLKRGRGVDLIFASDLRRTRETAEIVGRTLGVAIEFDPRIREFNVGEFNGRPIRDYERFIGERGGRWVKRPSGGETWRDVRKRTVAFLKDCERKFAGKTILIVSHGDPLFVLKGALRGLSEEEYFSQKYPEVGTVGALLGAMLPFDRDGVIDLHRPWIDGVTFSCRRCRGRSRGTMRRIPDVLDVWLDSGAMPFAARDRSSTLARPKPYPADFICEAIDQTRGWFYTLLALAVTMREPAPYRTVLCTGHVLDKQGKKMSKSRGNIVDPKELIGRYGADAVRWYFYTVNHPGESKRFDEHDVRKAQQRLLGTLWNTFVFWKTYAAKKIPNPQFPILNSRKLPLLDRWIRSRLNGTIAEVRERMDAYDITTACRAIERFIVDDLSNWYVRRSRDRFQRPESKADHEAASIFFTSVLCETVKLAGPFVPFIADVIFREVAGRSVHLEDFPRPLKTLRYVSLEEDMREVREVVASGLAARKAAAIAVRQPLAAIAVASSVARRSEFAPLILEELNVRTVRSLASKAQGWPNAGEGKVCVALDPEITPELRREGQLRELLRTVQEMRKTAGLTPRDRILVRLDISGPLSVVLGREMEARRDALRASKIVQGPKRTRERFSVERELALGNIQAWIGVRKNTPRRP